ncbi:MAG: class I SAM-dependent methyltransferase [Flavisolibacter sp.]
MDKSLERIIPDSSLTNDSFEARTLALHLERYHYAGRFIQPGKLADIACGVGYGSFLIATKYGDKATEIIAVDIDEVSIAYAEKHYHHPQVSYLIADVTDLQLPFKPDTIVSLETIEHLSHPEIFIRNMSYQLCAGGRFIVSVPITPSMDANPYHLHDFTAKSLRNILEENGLKEIDSFIQTQSYNPFSIIRRKGERTQNIRNSLLKYYMQNPGKLLLRIRSFLVDGFNNKYLVAVFEKK